MTKSSLTFRPSLNAAGEAVQAFIIGQENTP